MNRSDLIKLVDEEAEMYIETEVFAAAFCVAFVSTGHPFLSGHFFFSWSLQKHVLYAPVYLCD